MTRERPTWELEGWARRGPLLASRFMGRVKELEHQLNNHQGANHAGKVELSVVPRVEEQVTSMDVVVRDVEGVVVRSSPMPCQGGPIP